MANDERRDSGGARQGCRREKPRRHGGGRSRRRGGANSMSNAQDNQPVAAGGQESYIVAEGKKRGATRDVRMEAAHDKFYTVLKVHPGEAILTDNWHTNEVFDHAKRNFE